jgi:hypothetical protein
VVTVVPHGIGSRWNFFLRDQESLKGRLFLFCAPKKSSTSLLDDLDTPTLAREQQLDGEANQEVE